MKRRGTIKNGGDEHLQILIPTVTKRELGIRAVETREPIRLIVLKALEEYGITVPLEALTDRRRKK